ncbi:LTA synthase family protein [Isachenkonia alkalipeptolytica]|uniref:LTA synthase family protein n=1 Tax=Isachenkonia alkalipeptolytica TaxID=2565777 RepID=A0AA44BEV8_9CLOT|nr:LTA synthase family protein [Isachenkonia alkalipeptolytica]NBG87941.1 LTA synthase family protein [Isachenkonia alkalipeptolytica]
MNAPHRYLWKISLIMILPILLSEYLFRTEIASVATWLINHPFMFLLNLAVLVGLTLFFAFLFRRLDVSVWFVLMFSVIIGIVNANKFSLRSVPFMLNDFFLLRELWVLLPEFWTIRWVFLALFKIPVVIGAFFLVRKWLGAIPFKEIKKHVGISFVFCLGLIVIGNGIYAESHSPWELGFIYSLPRSIGYQEVVRPVGWDEIEEQIASEEESSEEGDREKAVKEEDPNVIIIMSESFWDVKELDVEYSQNPIAYFDSLKEESIHGDIYVPVFGGGTANSEFEVLTGLTLKNYPNDWHMVYREEIDYRLPSLASVFREAGYQTKALHPYHSWYYEREEVYPRLGFQETKFKEDLEGAETLGPFISDEVITDELIKQLKSTEEPVFSFTVTMQNHGPYNERRNPPVIDFETDLEDQEEEMLQIFTDGTYHSDQALKRLVEFLRDWEEPTLLLFFSDHLPMLGDNYSIYRDLGLIGEETPEELQDDLRLHTVPYILWSNYSDEEQEKPLKNASFLSPLILEEANTEKPQHMEAISGIHQRAPLITNSYLKDPQGNRYDQETEEYREVLSLYGSIRDQLVYEAKHLRGIPNSNKEINRIRQ